MSYLFNDAAALAVAFTVSLMAWLFGGSRADALLPVVPWALIILVEVAFCFPQRHAGESTYEARARVWSALLHSPVFWVSVGLLALLLVPLANDGLCPSCDAAAIAEGISAAPPIPFLPFCVDRAEHLNVVLWFAVALVTTVATAHCLTRAGKRLVLKAIVWNGVALALLGFVQGAMKAPGPLWTTLADGRPYGDFFATFGYPNIAGDYFTTLFGLAVALWRDQREEPWRSHLPQATSAGPGKGKSDGWFWHRHYYLLPAAVFYFAAINTLSRAAIVLVTALAVIFFAHALVVSLWRMDKSRRVSVGVWSLVVFGLVVFYASISMPSRIHREVGTLDALETLDRVTGKSQYHAEVATAIWQDHPLFGCGGWGYRHLCCGKMQELGVDLKGLQMVGGANVHNDYLQFLAEHGLVGFGAMVALAVLLLVPVVRAWRRLVAGLRFRKIKDLPPRPMTIFVLPAPAFVILLTLLATLIHAFGDCPLRSSAVLSLFYVALAAIPGFLPRQEKGASVRPVG